MTIDDDDDDESDDDFKLETGDSIMVGFMHDGIMMPMQKPEIRSW